MNYTFEDQKGILYSGFIAQEVETVLQEINEEFSGLCVPDNETGRYDLSLESDTSVMDFHHLDTKILYLHPY